jgi:hypothetical protein
MVHSVLSNPVTFQDIQTLLSEGNGSTCHITLEGIVNQYPVDTPVTPGILMLEFAAAEIEVEKKSVKKFRRNVEKASKGLPREVRGLLCMDTMTNSRNDLRQLKLTAQGIHEALESVGKRKSHRNGKK